MVHDLSDRSAVVFDDERVVVNAGLVLAVTLGRRLGLQALVDAVVGLGRRLGASRPGRKVLSLIHAMLLGADCIEDCDILRAGRTEAILGHKAMAPSTLGTFLRSFTFGHVRQLDRVLGESLRRAWRAGAGPGYARLVIDIDSFVGEVFGHAKQGAGYGYTGKLGYHPLLATRSGTNEVLHVGLRKGQANTQRGALRFVEELLARVRRAGASGEILIRADSGFWNKKVTARLRWKGCGYSIGVTNHKIVTAQIAQIPEHAWQPVIDYPDTGICELAETTLGEDRLIVRRVHLHAQNDQTELFAYWRHFALITNRTEPMHLLDAEHRQHAQVELVIPRSQRPGARALSVRRLHRQRRLDGDRLPRAQPRPLDHPARPQRPNTTGRSDDTPAAVCAPRPPHHQRTSQTLHLPARWPWQTDLIEALTRIRALPATA